MPSEVLLASCAPALGPSLRGLSVGEAKPLLCSASLEARLVRGRLLQAPHSVSHTLAGNIQL